MNFKKTLHCSLTPYQNNENVCCSIQVNAVLCHFATLSLSTFLVHGSQERVLALPEELPIEPREPKKKCSDWKFPKSTKKTKSGKSDQCYCPCCNEDSCQDLMDDVDLNPSDLEGLNDGNGPFCIVGGPLSLFSEEDSKASFRDICYYNENGNLDPVGRFQNLGDNCLKLGSEHLTGKCKKRRKRSRKLNRASPSNKRTVTTHKDGVTVEVKAAEPSSLDWIHSHVIEMKDQMEHGDVTGEWDLLFQAYFDNSHHIDMNCDTDSADSLSCKYSSQTQCGRDLISAHAGYHKEIADSIRNGGSHNIAKEQLKPDSCP